MFIEPAPLLKKFQDHIIVAVFADEDSPLIGLRNLVMPIRYVLNAQS
jgi:hypothetical protein